MTLDSLSLARARAFLIDGDGVLYRGKTRLPGAQSFISTLSETATPFLLLTNNATQTPQQVAGKLAGMGIGVEPRQIFTSALATASYLKDRYAAGSRVLPVGMEGLCAALQAAGFVLVEDHRQADLVVAALDRDLTYGKLAEAALAIRRGCPFVGTNPDRSFPSERGVEPGAGAILALLEAATDVVPTVIGKPQPSIFLQALERLGSPAAETVMVGDRYETDILGGHNAGLCTAAVLTGITTAQEFAAADPSPTWVFPDLVVLQHAWRAQR
jgi:4-nitrophenyl phosphatase